VELQENEDKQGEACRVSGSTSQAVNRCNHSEGLSPNATVEEFIVRRQKYRSSSRPAANPQDPYERERQ
jgi:hypothetical protein